MELVPQRDIGPKRPREHKKTSAEFSGRTQLVIFNLPNTLICGSVSTPTNKSKEPTPCSPMWDRSPAPSARRAVTGSMSTDGCCHRAMDAYPACRRFGESVLSRALARPAISLCGAWRRQPCHRICARSRDRRSRPMATGVSRPATMPRRTPRSYSNGRPSVWRYCT